MPARKRAGDRRPLHPANLGQRLTLAALWLLGQLPYGVAMRAGEAIGRAAYRLARMRRRIVERNLKLCFPERSADEREALARENFRYLGRALAEVGLAWYGGAAVDRLPCEVTGLEHLRAAQADGRPVILLSGHFMCVELAARLVGPRVRMAVIYKPTPKRPLLNQAMYRGRSRSMADVLPRGDIRGIVRTLRGGTPVWYAGDQDYKRRYSVFAPFFGVPAATITALSRLARMSDAWVVPLFFHALPGGRGYGIEFQPALVGFPSGDDVHDAERMNQVIEAAVRRHPAQYLWVHRRFKRQEDRGVDLYGDIHKARRKQRRRKAEKA